MKKVVLLIAMTLVFTSCSWLNDEPVETTETQIINVETEIKNTIIDETNTDEEYTENETITGSTSEDTTVDDIIVDETIVDDILETEITVESTNNELENVTEDEQLLNEVFNEINEVFELVEQNGGQ
jgi:hypothetical protein